MAKYIHIKANDGEDYMVEEVEATPITGDEDETAPVNEPTHDAEALSDEEISKVRTLLSRYDEIIALLGKTNDSDEDEEEMQDEDEDETSTDDSDEEKEGVVDTDEEDKSKAKDSKAKDSFGSLAKKKKSTTDSSKEAREIEICDAWAKRYKN